MMSERERLRASLIERLPGVMQESVSAGGVTTYYLVAGSGDPVVLLHGGGAGCNALNWGLAMVTLSRHFRVSAPDIVGHGESDKPAVTYDKMYFADWLHHFLYALDLTHINLVGSSMGGAISIQYTLNHPEAIKRLVLVNAAG